MERIEALRRQRFTGPQIARDLGVSPATVSRVLCRLGLNRITALEPAEPVRRYKRERPGELIHIDIKKLGRFERTGHRFTGDRSLSVLSEPEQRDLLEILAGEGVAKRSVGARRAPSREQHRSDSLSAAFRNLGADAKEVLTTLYEAFCPLRHDTHPQQFRRQPRERFDREHPRGPQERACRRSVAARLASIASTDNEVGLLNRLAGGVGGRRPTGPLIPSLARRDSAGAFESASV